MKEDNQNNNFTDEEKELVIFRIETTPSNLHLSIGGGKTMSKEDMIDHVKKGDKLGNQIIQSHLNFLRAVANGKLTDLLASV